MNWTNEQKQAIYEKGSNILVAAAAGSGKTAVLVERIINKIVNEKVDIDKILVVTFTNAAASEMRERILEAIYKKLEENPDDLNLQKQITLLNKSNICTIDSFCLEVVRNNFYELENISPNFRIADTAEIELIKQEVLEEIFEEKYENQDKDFEKLITTYTSYRDDTPLKDIVQNIYTYIQSNPFPEKWLNDKIEMFNLEKEIDNDFSKTIWGSVLLEQIDEILIEDITKLQSIEKSLSYDIQLDPFQKIIEDDIDKLKTFKQSLNNWDNAYEIFQNLTFATWSRKKVESQAKDEAKLVRDNIKKNYVGKDAKIKKILIDKSIELNKDIYRMYIVLEKLKNLILEFGRRFSNSKREKNIVDFSDIEHLALKILVQENNGEILKTDIAKKYSDKFEEIAIDEYQDSNLVQEYILTSISKGNNMFMVGDVKQSIYKFRQAMPELFLNKYSKYKIKEKFQESDDLKVQLFKNFRSRKNVLDFTNMIFENIMSNLLGDIEYIEEEFLNLGASYKNNDQDLKTQINVITIEKEQEEDDDDEQEERIEDVELEARFVANKIKEMIDSKFQVYDNKKQIFRDVTYKDIVILLRSPSAIAPTYEQEILKHEMPVFSDSSNQYLDSIEIETIMALLKIIDNPTLDIPLTTVLRSNIAGFTDNDLVEIRLVDKYSNFYTCMQKAKIQVNKALREKIKVFLDNLETWRKEQEYLALDELIWKIYSDTGYYNYVGLMPNGELRQANLKLLFEKAKQYETASFKGLYNFIRFIDKLKLNNGDLTSAKVIGENDNVIRIMSIHKSKGLEFPIVFLSSTGKQFNMMDLNKNILLHQEMGIGVKYIDYERQIEYDTLTKAAIKEKMLVENLSEEMRILYVALTRAKEKLIITGIQKDYNKKKEKLEEKIRIYPKNLKKINPILLKQYKTYLDWILLVYGYEKQKMEQIANINIFDKKQLINKFEKREKTEDIDIREKIITKNISKQDINNIAKIIEYQYPYRLSTKIPTKTSVSEIKQMKNNEKIKEISFSKPEFIKNEEQEKITGAKKGTLVHLCMQNLDVSIDYDINKVKELINDLEKREIITNKEAEAINPYVILEFTKTKIWKDLKEAKKVYKEKPFYIHIPAKEIYGEDTEEMILVQGIIDLYYQNKQGEYILLDYKTDYVEKGQEQELIKKYKKQIELYKRALEEALNTKVSKSYIYSTWLGIIEV